MISPLTHAIELFNTQQFFRCHEVLEEVWTHEQGSRRLFLQSLIHFAVGFYHWQRGNPTGADLQLRKGLSKLASYLPSCEGIETAQLHRDVAAELERIPSGTLEFPRIMLT